jgi:flagellar biosynthesis protein FlhF
MVEVLAAVDEYNSTRREPEPAKKDKQAPSAAAPVEQADDRRNITFLDEKEEKIAILENKVSSMEDMLRKIFDQLQPKQVKPAEGPADNNQMAGLPKVMQVFYNNLVKNEVDGEIAKKVIENVSAKLGTNSSVNDTANALSAIIAGILGKPDTIQPGQPGKPAVIMFVGPTGVGKTTTLAKIAANYLLNQKKSVGLITADTYRIAAFEQLKTYGEILGIPLSVVYSPGEIGDAIRQHSDKDIILIDTAGRSHRSKSQFEELKALVTAANADEVYLVLSATTSVRNCRDILSNYDFLKDYKLIFTKTDEAPLTGIILNVRYLTGKRLSYITTGQSVPDDIEIANIEKITKNLIGSIG